MFLISRIHVGSQEDEIHWLGEVLDCRVEAR